MGSRFAALASCLCTTFSCRGEQMREPVALALQVADLLILFLGSRTF